MILDFWFCGYFFVQLCIRPHAGQNKDIKLGIYSAGMLQGSDCNLKLNEIFSAWPWRWSAPGVYQSIRV